MSAADKICGALGGEVPDARDKLRADNKMATVIVLLAAEMSLKARENCPY